MKYHITITDNETGEILVDHNTCAIIGSCDGGDAGAGTRALLITNCTRAKTLATATQALEMVERVLRKEPKKLQRYVRKLVNATLREEARKNA